MIVSFNFIYLLTSVNTTLGEKVQSMWYAHTSVRGEIYLFVYLFIMMLQCFCFVQRNLELLLKAMSLFRSSGLFQKRSIKLSSDKKCRTSVASSKSKITKSKKQKWSGHAAIKVRSY